MSLRIYNITILMARSAGGFARRIAQHDPDLARQLQRAATSVPLNLAEGLYSQGGNRRARLHTAMGSANEVMACLDVGAALGYLDERDVAAERDRLDHIRATLYKLIRLR